MDPPEPQRGLPRSLLSGWWADRGGGDILAQSSMKQGESLRLSGDAQNPRTSGDAASTDVAAKSAVAAAPAAECPSPRTAAARSPNMRLDAFRKKN